MQVVPLLGSQLLQLSNQDGFRHGLSFRPPFLKLILQLLLGSSKQTTSPALANKVLSKLFSTSLLTGILGASGRKLYRTLVTSMGMEKCGVLKGERRKAPKQPRAILTASCSCYCRMKATRAWSRATQLRLITLVVQFWGRINEAAAWDHTTSNQFPRYWRGSLKSLKKLYCRRSYQM